MICIKNIFGVKIVIITKYNPDSITHYVRKKNGRMYHDSVILKTLLSIILSCTPAD